MVKKKKLVSSLHEKEEEEGGGGGESRKDEEESVISNEYERIRARQIKENMEKMKQLGIKLNINTISKGASSSSSTKRTINKTQPTLSHQQLSTMACRRTSPRLSKKGVSEGEEICSDNKGDTVKGDEEENHNKEVYTSEHENLLGDCKEPWPISDADNNSKRLYDSVNGTTCHQCRQKTLRLHTNCKSCHLPCGKLCGNCLFLRYGENLHEANENCNWSCPVCRNICNCSLCRAQKGWPPTGSIHNEAFKSGFKSVAHYLIHTRRGK